MISELLKITTCPDFWTCEKLENITRDEATGKRKDPLAIMTDVMACCLACRETKRIESESHNEAS